MAGAHLVLPTPSAPAKSRADAHARAPDYLGSCGPAGGRGGPAFPTHARRFRRSPAVEIPRNGHRRAGDGPVRGRAHDVVVRPPAARRAPMPYSDGSAEVG